MSGSLEVICGSMFSGKTEELMRRLRRAEYAKQNVLTIKHQIDDRGSYTCILSHDGAQREAVPLVGCEQSLDTLHSMVSEKIDVVGIDEVQFFTPRVVEVAMRLVDSGKRVIVSGLDLDFRGEPFGVMPTLLALADQITKLQAICVQCGSDAHHTQRLINGAPAAYDDPTILVGATECYEARCRTCFACEKKSALAGERASEQPSLV